jgi:DNA-binding IscR family transcriptional regulator
MENQQFATATHILTSLALHNECEKAQASGKWMTSPVLADSIGTNPIVVRRIVQRLSAAGILEVQRGKAGGVRLKKSPKDISLRDVYMAVEGKPAFACSKRESASNCSIGKCLGPIVSKIQSQVTDHLLKYLKGRKLSEIVDEVRETR